MDAPGTVLILENEVAGWNVIFSDDRDTLHFATLDDAEMWCNAQGFAYEVEYSQP